MRGGVSPNAASSFPRPNLDGLHGASLRQRGSLTVWFTEEADQSPKRLQHRRRLHHAGAESYFSRLRRGELGHHHHIAGPYLVRYAQEGGLASRFMASSDW